jgi:transcription elongation factor Elf1
MVKANFTCPACGFPDLSEAPRTVGGGGSYEICPSCGFEFGWTDELKGFDYEMWRALWVSNGMQWSTSPSRKPDGWNPSHQIEELLASAAPAVGYRCPVCGYPDLQKPPIGLADGSGVICPSCGFDFAVEADDDSYEAWRASWLSRGTPWSSASLSRPDGWDPIAQLRAL